ncbi:MAG: class I SAM-dependent methyltransferase [bacterium]
MSTNMVTVYNPENVMAGLSVYERVLLNTFSKIEHGCLTVELPGGDEFLMQSQTPGLTAQVKINNPKQVALALLRSGDIGFAESYIQDAWTSNDLTGLLHLLSINLDALGESRRRGWLTRVVAGVRHALNRNTRTGSKKNIAAHYDLGNDFYQQWLDPSMSYSAAVFKSSDDLEVAQYRKYEQMLALIDPYPDEHILEIGCGWGGFAEYAAVEWGMKVTAVTLSREQYEYAVQRMKRKGISDKVTVKLCDYRDLHGKYDHVVSIEMFEAVGREYWNSFFEKVNDLLRPGGCAAFQIITIRDDLYESYARNGGGFIQRYIFPGGMLPTEKHLVEIPAMNGLHQMIVEQFGYDYATTLAEWQRRFRGAEKWLDRNGYGEAFRRTWNYYLSFCEAGFLDQRINVVQTVYQKG